MPFVYINEQNDAMLVTLGYFYCSNNRVFVWLSKIPLTEPCFDNRGPVNRCSYEKVASQCQYLL